MQKFEEKFGCVECISVAAVHNPHGDLKEGIKSYILDMLDSLMIESPFVPNKEQGYTTGYSNGYESATELYNKKIEGLKKLL